MTRPDVSSLSGPDAVVALRTYPRRYRETLAALPDDPELEELATRVGPDGHSALDHLVHATHTFVLLDQGVAQVLLHDSPVLPPASAARDQRAWDTPPGTTLADGLDRLADAAAALADRVDGLSSKGWSRTGRVAGGGADGATVTVLDLVRDAVATGAEDLVAAETSLRAATA